MGNNKRKRKQNKGHEFRNNRQHNVPAIHKNGTVLFSNPQNDYGGAEGENNKDAGGPFQRTVNGQREAFPGLDDICGDQDGDFLGPANDGFEYLRMVRSEAKGVPNLLTANQLAPTLTPEPVALLRRPIPTANDLDLLCYDDPVNDEIAMEEDRPNEAPEEDEDENDEEEERVGGVGAFYSDGAYVSAGSAPIMPPGPTHASLTSVPLRAVSREWHNGIVQKFRTARQRLESDPPAPSDMDTPLGFSKWMEVFSYVEPTPSNLAAIDRSDAIAGLKQVIKTLKKGSQFSQGMGRWTWALLLRCDDPGILRNEEIGTIRELGKRASWCLGYFAKWRPVGEEVDEKEWWSDAEVDDEEEEEEGEQDPDESMEIDTKPATISPLMLRPRSVKVTSVLKVPPSGTKIASNPEETVAKEANMQEGDIAVLEVEGDNTTIAEAGDPATVLKENDLPENPISKEVNTGMTSDEPQKPLQHEPSQDIPASGGVQDDSLVSQKPTLRTLFTFDMILSIVGDVFGQKDLLLERR